MASKCRLNLPNSEQISIFSPNLVNSYLLNSFYVVIFLDTTFFAVFWYANQNAMCSGQTVLKLLQGVFPLEQLNCFSSRVMAASHSKQVQVCLLLHCFQ